LIRPRERLGIRGEIEASPLGWHPTETPSSTAFPIRNIIKKREKYLQAGGTRAKPSK